MGSFDSDLPKAHKPESAPVGDHKDTTIAFAGVHEQMSSRPDKTEKRVAQADVSSYDLFQGKDEKQWVDYARQQTRQELFPDGKHADASSTEVFDAMGKRSYEALSKLGHKNAYKQEMLHELKLDDGQKLTPESVTRALIANHAARENVSIEGLDKMSPEQREKTLKKVEDGDYSTFWKDGHSSLPSVRNKINDYD